MAGLPIFPSLVGVMFPVKRRGPIFDTVVQQAISGKVTTLPKRITPLWSWELSFDILRSGLPYVELQQLAGFYASRFGRAYPFGYVDPDDSTATNQLLGAGDGNRTMFQLVRSFGGFVEPVFLPTSVPQISIGGGAPLVVGTDVTFAVGGIATLAKPPAAGALVTWSGNFAWLCRFDQEGIDFSNFMKGLWSADKVSFTSVLA